MIRYCLPIAMFVLLLGVTDANAQRLPNINRRPAVSPYLNLFNNNQGGINNYFNFVRPMQNQARINQMQTIDNRFMQQQILGNQLGPYGGTMMGNGATQTGMLRPSNQGVGQPSIPASFFNYSHYYNVPFAPPQTSRRVR